jgi:hypothetical protein
MKRTRLHLPSRSLGILVAAALSAACADAPVAPDQQPALGARSTALPALQDDGAIATLQRVTARYHNLDAAIRDGFVLLHECETRPGEGPVGIVYVNFERALDGAIDPASPDALIYEPRANGRPRLVGVEFALPYPLWTAPQPPEFLGNSFQREDEFGVWALHIWVWRTNPEGLFAESNPRVSCGA